jgi:glutaminyl-tRNA synthetase
MSEEKAPLHFIEHIIEEDIANGFNQSKIRFRFPPEPNGFLHVGHLKAIALNFNLGKRYNAPVNLRFDDTNPVKENQVFVDAIKENIQWLGYQWDKECYASDYFKQLYQWAVYLIKEGKAYIDSQNSATIADQKGTPTQAGINSPFRERSIEENLILFEEMKQGKHPEGSHVLRAKIDMTSPNMLMRDPVMYRILFKHHHRTADAWCIYPMYDWTHGESDYIEQVSHSLCTLEFKPHRELYNWFLDQLPTSNNSHPYQREFARLNLSYTVTSKRKLAQLVDEQFVNGWDDPRMPTISGMRRRGYPPQALINFVTAAGISKRENVIEVSLLEYCVREELNKTSARVMAVVNPVKLVITNYPEDKIEELTAINNPEDEYQGTRTLPFSKELYIEREDFKEEANRKFFRLTLGKEVRLKNAYIIKGESVIKDKDGNITEIHCTYDLESKSGSGSEASMRKVKGTIHWVSVAHAIDATVRNYDRLFNDESPDQHKDKSFLDFVNPDSFSIQNAKIEPSLASLAIGERVQFQRLGYYTLDTDATSSNLVFNKIVGLRDTWAKKQ